MANTLVLYFSATQTTKRIAEQIAQQLGADLHELHAQQPYTTADLNWHDPDSRTSKEQHEHASRVAIQDDLPDLAGYQNILLGHPIWWGIPPRLITDTIDHLDLNGKQFAGFATPGVTGYGRSQRNIERTIADNHYTATVHPGAVLMNDRQIKQWLKELDLA